MYCHTSSSVQLLMGNTRKCSPGCRRVLNRVHSSGAGPWAATGRSCRGGKDALLGAGLFLVAAGAADQRVKTELLDGFQQRHRLVHVAALARVGQAHGAAAMESSTLRTMSSAPSSLARKSRKSVTSWKLWPVSIIRSG